MCWKKFGDFGVIFGVKIPNAWKYKIYLRVAGRGIFWVILEGFRRICGIFMVMDCHDLPKVSFAMMGNVRGLFWRQSCIAMNGFF